jgi:hypothetical protein
MKLGVATSHMYKAIIIVPIIAVAAVACGIGMRHSGCEDKVISQAGSADGKYVAICGVITRGRR